MHRTTFMLDEDLYREMKRAAVDRGRPMRSLVTEALRTYLGFAADLSLGQRLRFGVYRASINGPIDRKRIYGHLKGT